MLCTRSGVYKYIYICTHTYIYIYTYINNTYKCMDLWRHFRWYQVLTTSLWALTTVCSQRWGELTHNGSTENHEDIWARWGSIPCLLLKGRMLSVWQCFCKQHNTFHLLSWFFFIKFPSHSSEKSGFHRDFRKTKTFPTSITFTSFQGEVPLVSSFP